LLDFSRVEANRARVRLQPTDLAAFTTELASTFQSLCERAGLSLTIDCPPFPELVWVDQAIWEKVVLNLLSNAFKFTFEGGIQVLLRPSADGHAAALIVRDTGTGIPTHELPRIFERFHRIEGARGRSHEGSGIGLALVRDLVRLHGGDVTVESEMDQGTAFTVAIPFGAIGFHAERGGEERPPTQTAARAQAFVEEASRWLPGGDGTSTEADAAVLASPGLDLPDFPKTSDRGGRVLVADDNADMRDYVSRLLVSQGCAVEAVPNGAAALAAARQRAPDLVLSDVMMPGLDGLSLLRALRSEPGLAEIPVLLLSARAGEEARIEGLDAGADDYVTKPFTARELLARVRTNLKLGRLRRDAMARSKVELERLVEERTREHARVWRNSRDLLVVVGTDGIFRAVNPAWTTIIGHEPEEVVGRSFLEFVWPEDANPTQGALSEAAADRNLTSFENRYRSKDGSPRWISWHISVEGDLVYAYGRDVTAEKEQAEALQQAAEALRQSQKMEAVGQLTGGIAHDFNNLLAGISGSLELVQTRMAQGRINDLERFVTLAQGAVRRASSLTHRLLAFSRRQTLDPKPTNINRVVTGMEDLIRRTVGPAVAVEVVTAAGLWITLVDQNQLENALLNLCINGRDAMPDGGSLTIETANRWLDPRSARERGLEPGQYVSLCVSDTGTGMTPDVIAHAFDPFFTTKPMGMGTGLGLSMIYGFTRQSGGQVRITSDVGQGTMVCLYLPRHDGDEEATNLPAAPTEVLGAERGETVLVVDDDATVRMLVTEVLEDLGYVAIEAADAAAGLTILQSDRRIDLLVTDVGLPGGLNGRQLADAGQAVRPGLKVLFITGYAEHAVVGNGPLEQGMHVLTKPFEMEALAARIRTIIANP
jgi:PAS domain S-box-containing protein